jgi:hypothetical protein
MYLVRIRLQIQISFRAHIPVRVQLLLYIPFFFVFNANVSPFLIPVRVQLVLYVQFHSVFFVFGVKVLSFFLRVHLKLYFHSFYVLNLICTFAPSNF